MGNSAETVFDRIIREAKGSPHPTSLDIEKTVYFEGPWFHIGRRAIEILRRPEEIRDFMKRYVDYISKEYDLERKAAEETAINIIGYSTGYLDDDDANIWFDALPDISHPITGRERPFMEGHDVDAYFIVGRSRDEEIRDYLRIRLPRELSSIGFRFVDKHPIAREGSDYFAFRVRPSGNGEGSVIYLFLFGYIKGLEDSMKGDLKKSCRLVLETVKRKTG